MKGISAKVIKDSQYKESRLITLEIEIPRFILPQFNTHRVMSRNFQSSRAVPVKKMIEQVRNDPFIPVSWGSNQRGMVAGEELENASKTLAEKHWREAAESAANKAALMDGLGLSKQICNRVLEPFMVTKGVVTTTKEGWDSFFLLRLHHDSQPEIQAVAQEMYDAIEGSAPDVLQPGDWHLPYIYTFRRSGHYGREDKQCYVKNTSFMNDTATFDHYYTLEEAVKVSVSSCAQVSYRNLDTSLEKALKIYDMLNFPVDGVIDPENPPHCFDGETEVLTTNGFVRWDSIVGGEPIVIVNPETAQVIGHTVDYKLIKQEYDGNVFHYAGKNIDLFITEGHSLFGSLNDSTKNRKLENYKLFPANQKAPKLSRFEHDGERPMKMLTSAKPMERGGSSDEEIARNELFGFFIGDGSFTNGCVNSIRFNLKKERKVNYLRSLCDRIPGCRFSRVGCGESRVNIKGAKEEFSKFYNTEREKTIPVDYFIGKPQELIDALFKGLKNSDGSVRRDTWVYSTSSRDLKEAVICLGAAYGYGVTVSSHKVHENPNHKDSFILNITTKKYMLVNDSRSEQTLQIKKFKGTVYCADTGGNVLIVRRKGKIVLVGNCSPAEHSARVGDYKDNSRSANFNTPHFYQYRKMLEKGTSHVYIK